MATKTVHKQPQVLLRGVDCLGLCTKIFTFFYFFLEAYSIS